MQCCVSILAPVKHTSKEWINKVFIECLLDLWLKDQLFLQFHFHLSYGMATSTKDLNKLVFYQYWKENSWLGYCKLNAGVSHTLD